jgi:hypothetical protein
MMRARHRHFNPGHAGASIALDSRYGFSLADGNAVSTWDDRSPSNNDAGQSIAVNQPTYKTNERAGQPAVRFANNDDFMTCSALASAISASSVVGAVKSDVTTGSDRNFFYYGNAQNFIPNFNWVGAGRNFGTQNWVSGNYNNPTERSVVSSASFTTDATVATGITNDGGTNRLFLNGNADGTAVSTTVSISTSALPTIGRRGGQNIGYWSGDVYCVSWFTSAISSALRRRLEIAAAYSFKIACN